MWQRCRHSRVVLSAVHTMGESCPVCYEQFTAPPSPHEARLLACDHVLCASCISSELIDSVFYCTECGAEHRGASLDDISRPPGEVSAAADAVGTTAVAPSSSSSSDGGGGVVGRRERGGEPELVAPAAGADTAVGDADVALFRCAQRRRRRGEAQH